jgi:Type I phosphodiesterase / nucleotide pyrophosphatase
MVDHEIRKMFICYIPGMDLRRINTNNTPCIASLFKSYPNVKIISFPNTDLMPALLTGVYPHEHGMWQVRLKSESLSSRRCSQNWIPDILTTTYQCLVHLFNHSFDLATIPARRLRHFEIMRFKQTRHYFPSLFELFSKILYGKNFEQNKSEEWHPHFLEIGSIKTIFSIVGKGNSKFVFNRKFSKLNKILGKACSRDAHLEFLELHSLDIIEHWNLDDSGAMNGFYREVDTFIKSLHQKCEQAGVTLLILSDHGQEQVKGTIDIKGQLKRLDVSEDEYKYYLEAPMARFWFHTGRARAKIVDMLSSISNGTVLSYKDMHRYNVKFDHDQYGEIYFVADPGYIIFPHDFYQPFANCFLGLADRQQRRRIWNPKLKGSHGYLPRSASETGFMMALDHTFRTNGKPEIDVIDVAPSILALMGYQKPDHMTGSSAFTK